jgi:hypothetical protein
MNEPMKRCSALLSAGAFLCACGTTQTARVAQPAVFVPQPAPSQAVASAVPPAYPPPSSPVAFSSASSTDTLPSSGGYRPQTQSGSGEEGPRLEVRPQPSPRSKMPPPAPLTRLAAKTENGVTYLCGGIGQDEVNEMKEAARDYDLMLTFAARDGSYLADVNVDIADSRDKSLLKTTCNAPIMLLDLGRSGTYRIRAETGGNTVSKSVKVQPREPGKSVVMVWPVQAVRGLSEGQAPEAREQGEK